ncbi:hypothetical protein GH714_029881 [Hevea brasiliensis]|uniref:Uncharacterized protein n=1 Tax=Hevea brasiliensis TaxID=3981 RepID=A0A6A6LS89_HEVBR|nr:hypothetical protein GH714_029881 [Hevea brasiliensis]
MQCEVRPTMQREGQVERSIGRHLCWVYWHCQLGYREPSLEHLEFGVVAVILCKVGSREDPRDIGKADLLEEQVPHGFGSNFWVEKFSPVTVGVKAVQELTGVKSKVLPKYIGPSRLREELGSIETRLDKVEDHLTLRRREWTR